MCFPRTKEETVVTIWLGRKGIQMKSRKKRKHELAFGR